MQLYFRERGAGAPLVMLHGLFGSADNLGGIARILESDFRVIAPDLRNHGRSPHDDHMSYPLMAADVLALMDSLGLEKVHLFGHSMGGKTAMQLALNAPDRVSKLVVGDIAPVAYGHHHSRILEGMRAVADAGDMSRSDAEKILSTYVDEPDVLSFLLTNWRRQDDGTQGWRLNLDAIERDYMEIAAANTGGPFMGPTLFVRGGNSDYVQAEHREAILRLFPNASVRTVEGTGHWLHAEKPDLVARIVNRFLIG
ncbi:alpha/beta fold hydrolase [Kordiimonas marina]|uniref:alpha/beta fold hydrolase n=1 Tax=Kordiimonas marina TaxID=2872312 RepID=UPI001FF102DE|nr:alpha/beta fold hydrolase [Kordiimonas marina]MCJ9427603.1 alpha/beta fold hydrolase [Kordiimonas marina]